MVNSEMSPTLPVNLLDTEKGNWNEDILALARAGNIVNRLINSTSLQNAMDQIEDVSGQVF